MSDIKRQFDATDYNKVYYKAPVNTVGSSGSGQESTSTGKDVSVSNSETKGEDQTESAGTSQQESTSSRALTAVSSNHKISSERANIGCQVTFAVKIRGGLPLTQSPTATC